MKRALLLILIFLPMLASADAIEIDGIYYNLNPVDKIAEVTYGNWDPITPIDGDGRYSGEIAIPESVDYEGMSYSVTSIGYYAFEHCENLNAVTIPSSVTSIYICAFSNCSNLTSITIPNSVTSIERNAFRDCSGLISVSIPGSVTYIGESAFYGCSALTSITIPNSVSFIGSYAFQGCSGLTSFTIPDGMTSISEFVFNGCTSLVSVTLPEGLTSIGNYAFQNCSSLTFISIPSSVTSIGNHAFSGCSLTSLNIPNSITSIGDQAFRGCSSLTSLSIPSSVTFLGISPFYGCTGLTSIKVEEGNIIYDSRNNCNAIIKTDDNELITGCNNTIIPDDVSSIAFGAFSGCSGLTSVTIPNGVTSIGNDAFEGCTGLTSITIPRSVTSIGEWFTFSNCSGLNSIIVEEGNTVYDSRDNCNAIIKTADNKLLYGCNNTVIPNNVTSIGNYAFFGCSGLTSISIPNGVTSIESHAFYRCSSLTSIKIPNGVTSIEMGSFQECSGLTSITIPNNVTSIAELSFNGCSSLTSVIIGKSVTSIGYNVFSNCKSLKDFYSYAEKVPKTDNTAFDNSNIDDVTLYVPAASVSAYQAAEPWKNFKEIVALPESGYFPEGTRWTEIRLDTLKYDSWYSKVGDEWVPNFETVEYYVKGKYPDRDWIYKKVYTNGPEWTDSLTLLIQEEGDADYVGHDCVMVSVLIQEYDWNDNLTNSVVCPGTAYQFDWSVGKGIYYENIVSSNAPTIPIYYCYYGIIDEIKEGDFGGVRPLKYVDLDGKAPECGKWDNPQNIDSQGGRIIQGIGITEWNDGECLFGPTCPYFALQTLVDERLGSYPERHYRSMLVHFERNGEVLYDVWPDKLSQNEYRPFIEDGKVWVVKGSGISSDGSPMEPWIDYCYLDGDTIIGGQTCKRMMYITNDNTSPQYIGALYEQDKKVYYAGNNGQQFELLYDFTLSSGDNIQGPDGNSWTVNKTTGDITGFKGTYYDLSNDDIVIERWFEGVGSESWPNVNHPEYLDGKKGILLACIVGDDVIYYNSEEDDPYIMGARKRRIDFTHTIKIQPKARIKREKNDACINSSEREVTRPEVKARMRNGTEESMYGEYNDQQLCINLDPLDDTYQVNIIDESGKTVYEKDIDAGNIVGLNIDISTYAKGRYTVTVENSSESFTGEFGADNADVNGDGEVNVADVDYVIEHIGEALDAKNKAADVNDDGEINVADVDYIIERII